MVNQVEGARQADRYAVLRDRQVWAVATLTFPLIFAAQTVAFVVGGLLAQRSGWDTQASDAFMHLVLLALGPVAVLLYWRGGAVLRGIALAVAVDMITLVQWVFFS